ncbi:MAG: lysophospholipase [Rubripirellula sp.]|nr:lysophospholipase [Rubripirellula sp.]
MHHETLFTGRRGRLTGHLWTGDAQPRSIALVVHGLGDYAARFEPLASALVQQRFAVLGFDLPGHGKSPGGRGRADSFDGLLKDIETARVNLAKRYPGLPQFMVGHSMGGNLALSYALRQTLQGGNNLPAGLILCAPMLLPPTPPPRPHIFAAWLTGHLFPWIRITRPVDPSALTSDQNESEVIRTDPLRHSKITIYLATQLLSQGRWALDHARQLKIPTLILLGDEDPLIDRSACEHLAIRMGNRATLLPCQGMRHDLFHDLGTSEVLAKINEWIQAKASSSLD